MRQSHVVHDHHEIVLRCSEKIGAEHNSERFGSHVVEFFVICDSAKRVRRINRAPSMERTCQDVLTLFAEYQSWVEGAPGQQIECSLVGHQGFLALQNRVSYSTMNTKDQPTHGFHHIVVRRWREYWFRKNAEPRFHQIAQSMDISPFL